MGMEVPGRDIEAIHAGPGGSQAAAGRTKEKHEQTIIYQR
tara:strand:- start:258 stop:377 length:120 start_codon:yes stop_codon:yes gene_type:complete